MIDLTIACNASVFGDFSKITATPENTIKLMNLFRRYNFIPSTFQELSPPTLKPVLRTRLSTPDNEWAINIGSQRVVVERNSPDLKLEDMNDFIEKAADMFNILLHEYGIQGKRIALGTNAMLQQMSPEQLDSVYLNVARPSDFYTRNIPFEWNLRAVSLIEYDIQGNNEKINAVSTIGRIQGEMILNETPTEFDRINIEIDINTIPKNENARFSADGILEFLNYALRTREELINSLESVAR